MGRALRECPPLDCDKCVYGQDAGCQCCALVAQGTQEKTHEFDARDMNQTDPSVESPTSLRTSRCCLWPTPSRGRIRLPSADDLHGKRAHGTPHDGPDTARHGPPTT